MHQRKISLEMLRKSGFDGLDPIVDKLRCNNSKQERAYLRKYRKLLEIMENSPQLRFRNTKYISYMVLYKF